MQRGLFEMVPGISSPGISSPGISSPEPATAPEVTAAESAAVEQPGAAAAGIDERGGQVLAALDSLGGMAAIGQLVEHTGLSRGAVRRRLGRLIKQGRLRRIGQGLKTRYQLVEK